MSDDAISRRAAISNIREMAEWHTGDAFNADRVIRHIMEVPSVTPKQTEITLESAIDYLNSIGWMQEHDRILTESAQSVTPKQRWIPVSERLPNECIKVLVWERYYSYKRERYVYDYNFGWLYDEHWFCEGGGESKVFAWMPLPKPYEPQESEEQADDKPM